MLPNTTLMRPYNTNSRNIFPFSMEGCVLYLPLWQEDMQGTPILSYDQYHHSCTVTGATWGTQGRTFDGTDDYISLGTPAALQITTLSVIAWVKRGTTGSEQKMLGSTGNGWAFYFRSANNLGFGKELTSEAHSDTLTITDTTTWHQAVITYDGTTAKFYIDLATKSAAYANPTFASTAKAIGIKPDDLAYDFNGSIGEVLIYNRALTAAEIMNNYLSTKWRYT